MLDVVAAVKQARLENGNLAVGAPSTLDSVGEIKRTYGSGKYFLESFATVGEATITIDGVVALYLDGDLESVGQTRFELTAGSTLDLYVAGSVSLVGESMFNHAAPGTVRLYVGGPQGVLDLVGSQEVIGSVYAPDADLSLVGDTRFIGSVFARNLDGVGKLEPPVTNSSRAVGFRRASSCSWRISSADTHKEVPERIATDFAAGFLPLHARRCSALGNSAQFPDKL